MKTVLLTGVTGFVGSHTAIQLLNKGYKVIGTLRDLSRAEEIRGVIGEHTKSIESISFAEADLKDDPSAWQELMKGVDYVQHIASPLPRVLPGDESELIGPAREGALNVLTAARNAGVKRVVMTSSIAAIMYGKRKNGIFTEEDWSDENNRKDHSSYTRSKTIAEKAAWDFIESEGGKLEFVVVNPGGILGPVLEKDYGTSAEIVKKMMDGSLPAFPKIGFPLVDVRSVAEMQILAMEVPQAAGNRFICAGEYYFFKDIAEELRKAYPKQRIPKRQLPDFLLRFLANFDKTLENVLMELGAKRIVDSSKARTMLGWRPIDEKEAILATSESLFEQGILTRK